MTADGVLGVGWGVLLHHSGFFILAVVYRLPTGGLLALFKHCFCFSLVGRRWEVECSSEVDKTVAMPYEGKSMDIAVRLLGVVVITLVSHLPKHRVHKRSPVRSWEQSFFPPTSIYLLFLVKSFHPMGICSSHQRKGQMEPVSGPRPLDQNKVNPPPSVVRCAQPPPPSFVYFFHPFYN
jgi:hypothetical protein